LQVAWSLRMLLVLMAAVVVLIFMMAVMLVSDTASRCLVSQLLCYVTQSTGFSCILRRARCSSPMHVAFVFERE
jgi:uncharacterized BrkB/YihY/UPF0761 family membrane protein